MLEVLELRHICIHLVLGVKIRIPYTAFSNFLPLIHLLNFHKADFIFSFLIWARLSSPTFNFVSYHVWLPEFLIAAETFPQQPEPKSWCSWALGPQAGEWWRKGYRKGELNSPRRIKPHPNLPPQNPEWMPHLIDQTLDCSKGVRSISWVSDFTGLRALSPCCRRKAEKAVIFHSVGNSFLSWCSWKAIEDRADAFPSQGVACPDCPRVSTLRSVLWAFLCSDLAQDQTHCGDVPSLNETLQESRMIINYLPFPEMLEGCFYLFELAGGVTLTNEGLCRTGHRQELIRFW